MIRPESLSFQAFLRMCANSFILTEIIEPHSIRNPGHIRLLLELASLSTGKPLSARKICQTFGKQRTTISPQAALDYLDFCKVSGILISIPVIDLDDKKILDGNGVWYFGDTGLRSAFLRKKSGEDLENALETLIALHLSENGWSVSQGRIVTGNQNREEITFVCEKEGKKMYLQTIAGTATAGEKLRKRTALLSVRDAWPKFIVDSTENNDAGDGIQTRYIRDFLLESL
jgi:predicted AAA+ superfamily ATPase